MSQERDLSISITGSDGEEITWRPRNPLPPESHFHCSPPLVAISTEPSQSRVPTPQASKITFPQRLKMLFKAKMKNRHRGVQVINTGNNPYDPATTPKRPTILNRFKNLWTHTQKPNKRHSHSPLSLSSSPVSRGRRLSGTPSWRSADSILFYDPSPQRFRSVEESVDISPMFDPKQGGIISHRPIDSVSAQRLKRLSAEVDDMMVLSITRSPAMTPVFLDDVPPTCNTSDNQKNGNIGLPKEDTSGILVESRESLVDISLAGLYHHQSYDFERSCKDVKAEISSLGEFESGEASPQSSPSELECSFQIVIVASKADSQSRAAYLNPREFIPNELNTPLALPQPEYTPLYLQSDNIPTSISEAMNSHISPAQRSPSLSATSVYSYPPFPPFSVDFHEEGIERQWRGGEEREEVLWYRSRHRNLP